MSADSTRTPRHFGWIVAFLASAAVEYFGAKFGKALLVPSTLGGHFFGFSPWYANWDGQWYNRIAKLGYSYDAPPDPYSDMVFFPLYPLLGALVHAVTQMVFPLSLLTVSLGALALCCWQWQRYCLLRLNHDRERAELAMLLLLFWPMSLFLRVDYTESLFVCLLATLLYGFAAKWGWRRLVLIAGLASATRPPGIICALAVGVHLWRRMAGVPMPRRALYTAAGAGASAWGLWCYMAYLWLAKGDPLLFITGQHAWNYPGNAGFDAHAVFALITLQPLWSVFYLASWQNPADYYYLFTNKVLWLGQTALMLLGMRRRWLTAEELCIGLGILLMAYIANGMTKDMMSVGRYSLAVLPAYLVLARLLAPQGRTACTCFIAASAALLFFYSGLFAKTHFIN